jgi:hypothetical protein
MTPAEGHLSYHHHNSHHHSHHQPEVLSRTGYQMNPVAEAGLHHSHQGDYVEHQADRKFYQGESQAWSKASCLYGHLYVYPLLLFFSSCNKKLPSETMAGFDLTTHLLPSGYHQTKENPFQY